MKENVLGVNPRRTLFEKEEYAPQSITLTAEEVVPGKTRDLGRKGTGSEVRQGRSFKGPAAGRGQRGWARMHGALSQNNAHNQRAPLVSVRCCGTVVREPREGDCVGGGAEVQPLGWGGVGVGAGVGGVEPQHWRGLRLGGSERQGEEESEEARDGGRERGARGARGGRQAGRAGRRRRAAGCQRARFCCGSERRQQRRQKREIRRDMMLRRCCCCKRAAVGVDAAAACC